MNKISLDFLHLDENLKRIVENYGDAGTAAHTSLG
jgi:hypothetical protein